MKFAFKLLQKQDLPWVNWFFQHYSLDFKNKPHNPSYLWKIVNKQLSPYAVYLLSSPTMVLPPSSGWMLGFFRHRLQIPTHTSSPTPPHPRSWYHMSCIMVYSLLCGTPNNCCFCRACVYFVSVAGCCHQRHARRQVPQPRLLLLLEVRLLAALLRPRDRSQRRVHLELQGTYQGQDLQLASL
uniref:Uncharacterized protein n=1 Tax=Aegilops tauschii subsp. strangulata TaxID=200361 RepID=A0A453NCS6_AEGTS